VIASGSVNLTVPGGPFIPNPDPTTILPNSFVRNALKSGLQYRQAHGINPFQLGFVGGTDNHDGTPSATDPTEYARNGAHGDVGFAVSGQALNETFLVGLESNPGGLTGIWAEENSRDALFTALKRRETFATSGTRPVVRLFGGFALPENLCQGGDFAARGYAHGVPMGGTLPGQAGGAAPRFAVSAMMDPLGWGGLPGTPLQLAQIIKGWVDEQGNAQEKVYDVFGDRTSPASVDLQTCTPQGGFADLCAVWTDPEFDPRQHAFYYARVLEAPSCAAVLLQCPTSRLQRAAHPTGGEPPVYRVGVPAVLRRLRPLDGPATGLDLADLVYPAARGAGRLSDEGRLAPQPHRALDGHRRVALRMP
jgi:hypothetical protein